MPEEAVKPSENLDIFSTRPMSETAETKVEDVEGLSVEDNEAQKKEAEIKKQQEEDAKKAAVVAQSKPEPIKFANETSEKYFNYLKEGKVDDVYNLLHEQRTLASVDKMTDEARIKLDLKYQNPDLDDNDINGLFEETYERPDKPVLAEDPTTEDQDDYDKELAKWEKKNKAIDNKIARASKQATKSLTARTSELTLPDITKAEPQPTAEQIEQAKKQQEDYLKQVDKGVSEFNGFSTTYKDKEVEIPIAFTIDEEEKKALQPVMRDFNANEYLAKRWIGEDGTFDGKKATEDRYKLENFDTIMQKVANEAGSRRLKAHLESKHHINFNGSRQAAPIGTPNAQQQVQSWQEQAFGKFQ